MPLVRIESEPHIKTLQDLLYERRDLMDRQLLLPQNQNNSDENLRIRFGIQQINREIKELHGVNPIVKTNYIIFPGTRFERRLFSRKSR